MSVFDYAGANAWRFPTRSRLPLPDHSRRKFVRAADKESTRDEEAVPSSRTNAAMQAYLEARVGGDMQSAWDAVKDAALSWRADNNAGGIPVYGHLPPPRDAFARKAGEVLRVYLEIGAPLGGSVKAARFAPLIKSALEKRGVKAVMGGVLSVMALYRSGQDKKGSAPPNGLDYALAFVSGAITGGVEPRLGKAEFDGAVAFASSVLGDILSQRPVDVGMALVAGTAACLVSKAGGWVKFKQARTVAQAAGILAKKYFEKEAKQFLKGVFGSELVMVEREWARFFAELDEYIDRQWDEFVQRGDIDPT